MSERLVIDPVTRIEGHLRIEAQLKDGAIEEALEHYHMDVELLGLTELVAAHLAEEPP